MRKNLRVSTRQTAILLLPLVFVFGCQPKTRPPVSTVNADDIKIQNSDIPVSTDTAKAVSLITRVRSFGEDGLNVVTIARSLQGQNKRIETLTELREESSISMEIHRRDLKKIFRLDPKNKTFMELPLPKKNAAAPASKKSKQNDCLTKSEINGPGPFVQLDNKTVQLYKVNTKMVCRDAKTRKETRRYVYREYVWVSNKPLMIDPALNISTATLYSYDMLAPAGTEEASSGRPDIARESAELMKKHAKTVLSIPGTPVRRDQVSTLILNGKEIPFTASEKSNYLSWQSGITPTSAAETPVSSTAAANGSLKTLGQPRIPDWVLSVDPAFAKHGGSAQRVDYMDIKVRNPKGLFDVPTQYRQVSAPK